jgi:CRISPR-associated protein Csd1
MILQALKGYYDRLSADPDSEIPRIGWEYKEIPFVIVLNPDGALLAIEDTREGEGKKRRARSFLVPQAEKKTANIAAHLLWDTAAYVFGIDTKGKPERARQQRDAFRERLVQQLGELDVVRSVIRFLDSITLERLSQEPCWEEIASANPVLSFRMNEDLMLICQRPEVQQRINSLVSSETEAAMRGTCLVTGQDAPIKRLHSPIKGVYGAQSTGANIVSFNLNAFVSYGKAQGFNAPVGIETEFAYTTALNRLLNKDSRQRMRIGDATTVFWSEKPTQFESDFALFFDSPEKDDPSAHTERVRALYESLTTGAYVHYDGDILFYVLGLSPNASRLSIRFWHRGTIAEFATRIKEYYDDFRIIKPPNEPEFYSLWQVLANVAVQNKASNIPPNLAGDFMRAILNGLPYPRTLLQAAIRRIRSDPEYRVTPIRAALVKAYLSRYYRFYPHPAIKEVGVALDINHPSVGYQLGRLFAVLEKIQEEANPGLNATIRQRYYAAACSTPVTVYANLMRLKNHHLAKLAQRNRVIWFEQLLGEIIEKLDEFPAHLDLHEQGMFSIGYYHQRQAIFTKKQVEAAIQ